jgi:hypothetical protein
VPLGDQGVCATRAVHEHDAEQAAVFVERAAFELHLVTLSAERLSHLGALQPTEVARWATRYEGRQAVSGRECAPLLVGVARSQLWGVDAKQSNRESVHTVVQAHHDLQAVAVVHVHSPHAFGPVGE